MSALIFKSVLCLVTLWLLINPAYSAPVFHTLSDMYSQLKPAAAEQKESHHSSSSFLIPALLPIPETPAQLSEQIDNLRRKLASIATFDIGSYKQKHTKANLLKLEALYRELSNKLSFWQDEVDRYERLLLKHSGERNQIQKAIHEAEQLKQKKQPVNYRDSIAGETINCHESLIRQLENRALLIPLSQKRYGLELQLANVQVDHILRKKLVLEELLEASRLKAIQHTEDLNNQDAAAPGQQESSAHELSDQAQLLKIEQELRKQLSRTRKDVLIVQQLEFDLEFQMKELGHVSEVYELLENQRACLLQLDLTHSGKALVHQLKLKRTLIAEKIRSFELSAVTFHQRQNLEQIIAKLDQLIPLAVELWELEKELLQRHQRVLRILEQRRMWMAVGPSLSPSQFLAVLGDVKKQLELLTLEFDIGHFSRINTLILFLLILALLLANIPRSAQKRLLNKERTQSALSSPHLCKLVLLIIAGSVPIPLWLAFSGMALQQTSGYTSILGQVLSSTAIAAFGWSVISAFGHQSIQQRIGVRQEGYLRWHRQTKILGVMSISGLLLGGFGEGWYQNPYEDRISQVSLLLCSTIQALVEWRLIRQLRPEFGYYSFKLLLTLLFPVISLLTVLLAIWGYNLAAWVVFSHKQLLMLGLGVLVLFYELSLYLLFARTRRMTLEHALYERKQTAGDIGPEDALEASRSHIRELQLQGKRLLQVVTLLIFTGAAIWLAQDSGNLIEPLGNMRVWPFTHLESGLPLALGGIAQAAIILALTLLVSRNLTGILRLALPAKFLAQPAKAYTLSRFSIYTVWFSSCLLILNTLGISWEKLQWLILAVSVGIGFGLQEIVANFFSGLIILLERPFRVGDTVTVGDVEGEVKQIHIRATIIEDFDRKELIVPNKTLVTGEVTNWSLSTSVLRVVLWFGVAHGSDNDLVFQLLMLAADECQKVLREPPPEVYFIEYTEHCEKYELRIFVNHVDDRFPARNQVNTRVKELLAENGVTVAHSQQDVHLIAQEALKSSQKKDS